MKTDQHFRYILGKKTIVCPACRRRTFKPFVDRRTNEILDSRVGRCNREIKCAYFKSPRDYFAEGGKPPHPDLYAACRPLRPTSAEEPSFIPVDLCEKGWARRSEDSLFRFLERRFGHEAVSRTFADYDVGLSAFNGSSTVFWQIDRHGRIRGGKVMTYDPATGRRIKDSRRSQVIYVHALLKMKFNYVGCFFGEHLAALNPDKPLVMVESEKTALILALMQRVGKRNDYVFMATGGASGLSVDRERIDDPLYRLNIVKGRRLILVPDADMVARWTVCAGQLAAYARSVKTIDVTRAPYCLTGSADIGDWTLAKLL